MKAPEKIYLQICGSCENDKVAPAECEQCQLDNPIDPESVTWCKDRIFPNDVEYVRADVLARVYQLLKDQKEFFRTKAPGLRDDCKRRENGFIKWYEQNFMAGKKEVSNQTTLFQ